MPAKRKGKIKVGDYVWIRLRGPVERIEKEFYYVRIVVRSIGVGHEHGEAVCYRDEIKKEK